LPPRATKKTVARGGMILYIETKKEQRLLFFRGYAHKKPNKGLE